MSAAKSKPESHGQAADWEATKKRALEYGFCIRCASQYAWGVQGGFSTVQPPCRACAPLVASLPRERVNGWRSVSGASPAAKNWPVAPTLALPRTPGASPSGIGARKAAR